jgi:hypothetical protein
MSDPRVSFLSSLMTADISAILDRLSGTAIHIVLTRQAIEAFSGQVAAYQLATLLARLFDRISLEGDESVFVHPEFGFLQGAFVPSLQALLPTLRPIGSSSPSGREVRIVIGHQEGRTGDLFLGASGWAARISRNTTQAISESRNPVGALGVGTLGAGEVFKLVFGDRLRGSVQRESYEVSFLSYATENAAAGPDLPSRIDLDGVLYGSGSIACGLLLGLLATPRLTGELTIVDNARFDHRNPYKYALLDWPTAQTGMFKAVWAADRLTELTRGRVVGRAFVGTASEYVNSLPSDYRLSLAISAVDTAESRSRLQDTLPRRILNAGITGTTVETSVHGFGDDGPCLACLTLQQQQESWSAKPISEATGLHPDRVRELIEQNGELTSDDILCIKTTARVRPELLDDVDGFVGQQLLSFWNRVVYSEATIHGVGEGPVRVTTAYVSAFAGVLLLAELLKELVPEFHPYRVRNSYRQDLLGIPTADVFRHPRDPNGWCLCHSAYRQSLYRDKYSTMSFHELGSG